MNKKKFLILFLLAICVLCRNVFAFSQDLIEIDLVKNQAKLIDFDLGGSKFNGNFLFSFYSGRDLTDSEDSSLILELKGSGITFGDKGIPWLEARLALSNNLISIPYLYLPNFIIQGEVDLASSELNLNLEGSWLEQSRLLEGEVKVKVKAWGGIGSFLTSGHLVVDGGKYKGKDFSYLRIDFLGRLPVLNITDSQLVLTNGNIVEIEGVLDLRDFSDILPGAEYSPRKVFVGKWQLFSGDDRSPGLKKQLDDKINVVVNTDSSQGQEAGAPETELFYNWNDDKFLRLRMEDKGTTFRIENRKDF